MRNQEMVERAKLFWLNTRGMCCMGEVMADFASAEVARALAAAPQPAPGEPYGPKVGDVVRCYPRDQRVVTKVLSGGDYEFLDLLSGADRCIGSTSHATYVRPATPAERIAAGLDEPAPGEPTVDELRAAVVDQYARWRAAGLHGDEVLLSAAREAACRALAARLDGGK